jgi:hypothetical protein
MQEEYERLLREFAQNVHLDPIEDFLQIQEVAVNDTVVSLALDQENTTHPSILLLTDMGVPSVEQDRDLYRSLLEANMLWLGTEGATFSVHGETGSVILTIRHRLSDLDAESLESRIGEFVDIVMHWQDLIGAL